MDAIKEGYVSKEGGKYQNWKDRYLVIETEKLSYYTNENKKKKKGEIWYKDISEAKGIDPDYKGKKFVFCLSTKGGQKKNPNRTYYIQAGDETSRQAWVASVQQLIYGAFVDSINQARASLTNLDYKKISVNDFERLRCIGQGGFGRVLLVRKKNTNEIYAMKILKKQFIMASNQVDHTTTERNVLVKIQHPFLPVLHYAFQDQSNLYFVMDFINGGELFFHLRQEKRFSEERTKFYAAQIVSALLYLHSHGIIYRDLKPENVLLTKEGDVIVTDFGLAKEGLHGNNARTSTRAGTPEYLAPEIIKGEAYTKAVDWWSVGILVYEMISGIPPFVSADIQELFDKILRSPISIPAFISMEASDFISKLLQRNPIKRLCDPIKIMNHPWFKSIDWKKLEAKQIPPPFVPQVTNSQDVTNIDNSFLSQDVEDTDLDPTVNHTSVTLGDIFVGFTFMEDQKE